MTAALNMSDLEENLKFCNFYKEIRSHFSNCISQYDNFKLERSIQGKIEFLLRNEFVSEVLNRLEQTFEAAFPQVSKPDPSDKLEEASPKWLNPKSGKYPQLSSSCKVAFSQKSGRRIVATKKILPGEIVIWDKPLAITLFPEFQKSNCLECFKNLSNSVTSTACDSCAEHCYCSEQCKSSNTTHWASCGIGKYLVRDDDIGPMAMLVFNLMVKVGRQECIRALDEERQVLEKQVAYDGEDYASAFLQVDHLDERDPGDSFRRINAAFYIIQFLRRSGFFDPKKHRQGAFFSPENDNLIKMCQIIVHHLQACSCNAYEVSELQIGLEEKYKNRELGGAIYPTVSLTNHSCFPNTMRYNQGNMCILRANRTINVGEEIFDNYGVFYQMMSTADRQARLKQQYFFECHCRPCRENWPQLVVLRSAGTTYLCQFCRKVVAESSGKKCGGCKKPVKLAKLAREMEKLESEVREAFRRLAGADFPAEALERRFQAVLAEMEKSVKMPNWLFVLCQQFLSHCYSKSGNSVLLQD